MTSRLEFLQRSELFAGLPAALLQRIQSRLTEVGYPRGATVFEAGEQGDSAYLVLSGRLELIADGVKLLDRHPGDCVGEFALMDEGPRSVSAVAGTDLTLLRWDRDDFHAALTEHPELAQSLFRMLTGKLRQDVNHRLEQRAREERWQQDLARAREIQRGMLPPAQFDRPGVQVAGVCRPARDVGGDFYDCLALDGDRTGLIIADVTGHGFYSALFVAMAKSCLHTRAHFGYTPVEIMGAMRGTLDLTIGRRLLMSCCYLLLDPAAGTLSYANAGHPYPYLYSARGDRLQPLEALDTILGVLEAGASVTAQRELPWRPGDLLVLYSDGVTEARSPDGELFGHPRLEGLIRAHSGAAAGAIRDALIAEVTAFAAGASPSDDLTLVVAKAV